MRPVLLLVSAAVLAGVQPATAQTRADCLGELQFFREAMRDDGFWLSGFRENFGWPAASTATRHDRTAAQTAPGLGEVSALSGSKARARAAGVQALGGGAIRTTPAAPGVAPWDATGWRMPPIQEMRTLHAAAVVMARRGEEQLCQQILAELREAHDTFGEQLRQAGVTGERIGDHRRQLLAAARPVAELGAILRTDTIIGADVRSADDEHLGSLEDVVLDPEAGGIAYGILARGGFLGIGQDYVAVPWNRLRAAPRLDLFVLDASAATLEAAPDVDVDGFADPRRAAAHRQQIDQFWEQQAAARPG